MHLALQFTLFLFFAGFAAIALYAKRSSIRLNGRGWESLLGSVQAINLQGVQYVAKDYLEPHKGQTAMEPQVIWQLLGGESGLRRMRSNADLLIALAAHASQWNTEEGTIVTERMRRDALRLRSAVRQVRFGMLSQVITGNHWVSVPFQLQEAASAYYLMRQRLLALYETSHVGLLPQLAQAV